MKRRVFKIVLLLILGMMISCGRKGAPKPPEDIAPVPVKYLTAKGEVDAIVLSWNVPDETAKGEELIDLAGFIVKRNVYEAGEQVDFEEIADIPFVYDVQVPLKDTPKVEFRDEDVEAGVRYQYQVVGYNEDGVEGEFGNIISVLYVGTSTVPEIL